MKKIPHIEVWSSNHNQTEVHFFYPNGPNMYIAGFNPSLIPIEDAISIIQNIGFIFPIEAKEVWWKLNEVKN